MNTKERLLLSAKEVFSEKGFHKTKVSDIVKKAGVSQGTFYIYFKSKEEIFKELILQLKEKILKIVKEKYDSSLEGNLLQMNKEFLKLLYENKKIAEIFLYQIFPVSESFKKIYFETVEEIRRYLTEIIDEAVKKEHLKNVSPDNIANMIIGYKRMVFEDYILLQRKSFQETLSLSEEGIKIILAGLKS